MPKIVISAIAHAYSMDPPSDDPIESEEAFAFLHGMFTEESCLDFFETLLFPEDQMGGGQLRLVYDRPSHSLRVTTSFDVPRDLNEKEKKQLVKDTLEQWSDGIGSGSFESFRGEVLSAALAKAIQNADASEVDLGDYCVDVYPLVEDRDLRVEYFPEGNALDDMMYDIVEAAESGDPFAQFELGRCYEDGEGVDQDYAKAAECFRNAAEQGHPVASTYLGVCYRLGRGVEQNATKALECFQVGVDADFALAMHCMGECCEQGFGVKQDPAAAVEWYRRGAELSDPGCMAELGECLEFGRGVEQDLDAALELYEECFDMGFEEVEEAIERLRKE